MDEVKKLHARFVDYLGIDIDPAGMADGIAELSLELGAQHLNSAGMAHGGVLTSLVDSAAGAAVYTLLPRERMAVTTDLHATCLGNTGRGRLYARGEVVHRGQRLLRADVDVREEGGRLLCRGSVSFLVIDRPRPAPGQ